MQAPTLSLLDISGRSAKFKFLRLFIDKLFKNSGLKSFIFELKSLIFPSLSKTAGFSFPLIPIRKNFIVFYNINN